MEPVGALARAREQLGYRQRERGTVVFSLWAQRSTRLRMLLGYHGNEGAKFLYKAWKLGHIYARPLAPPLFWQPPDGG
jgi:hypothetical protein